MYWDGFRTISTVSYIKYRTNPIVYTTFTLYILSIRARECFTRNVCDAKIHRIALSLVHLTLDLAFGECELQNIFHFRQFRAYASISFLSLSIIGYNVWYAACYAYMKCSKTFLILHWMQSVLSHWRWTRIWFAHPLSISYVIRIFLLLFYVIHTSANNFHSFTFTFAFVSISLSMVFLCECSYVSFFLFFLSLSDTLVLLWYSFWFITVVASQSAFQYWLQDQHTSLFTASYTTTNALTHSNAQFSCT